MVVCGDGLGYMQWVLVSLIHGGGCTQYLCVRGCEAAIDRGARSIDHGSWCMEWLNYRRRRPTIDAVGSQEGGNYGCADGDGVALAHTGGRTIPAAAPAQGVVAVPACGGEVEVWWTGGNYLRRRFHRSSNSLRRARSSVLQTSTVMRPRTFTGPSCPAAAVPARPWW